MYTYGQFSIPILLGKHPVLAPLLRLDFLSEPFYSLRRLFFQLSLLPLFYYPICWAVKVLLRWYVPARCFDYLWWYNRTRGYLKTAKQNR
jgi:hypothetical protein